MKKGEQLYDIFISYAKDDESIARRLYHDFKRHRLNVWEFRAEGEIGVDFEYEFKSKIEKSQFFLLIDSPYARSAKYVEMECLFATIMMKKNGVPKIIICNAQERKEWKEKELFERQNYISYIDFINYEKGIKELFSFFNMPYLFNFSLPIDKDFEEEMGQIKMSQLKMDAETWQLLMNKYKKFTEEYNSNKKHAEIIIQYIIFSLKEQNIYLKTPHLALGILQAEVGNHSDSLLTFQEAIKAFNDEPRFWACIAGAQYYLTHYEGSIKSYCKCIELINLSDNKIHKSHLYEIVHNLNQVLCLLGKNQEACSNIQEILPSYIDSPEIEAIFGKILLNLGEFKEACKHLEKAYKNYKQRGGLKNEELEYFSSIILDLAECYKSLNQINREQDLLVSAVNLLPNKPEILRRYAIFLFETANYKKANDYFQRTIVTSHGDIKYRSEFALILYESGKDAELSDQIEECFNLEKKQAINSAIGIYYLGLTYFLCGQEEIAKNKYTLSKEDIKIKDWPYYDKLTTRKDVKFGKRRIW